MNDGMSVTARDLALLFSSHFQRRPEQIPNVESATAISETTALINAAKRLASLEKHEVLKGIPELGFNCG